MASWNVLDLSDVRGAGNKRGWFPKKVEPRKNPDDYVHLYHGLERVGSAHACHAGPSTAMLCELTGLLEEDIFVRSVKTMQQSTGVKMTTLQEDLFCICCEDGYIEGKDRGNKKKEKKD